MRLDLFPLTEFSKKNLVHSFQVERAVKRQASKVIHC
ncbi:Uncharacterised protein [uncultured archaeon]|nr:Uncharacterised protein [uncultured archaeon]